jgi:hypothetical protein
VPEEKDVKGDVKRDSCTDVEVLKTTPPPAPPASAAASSSSSPSPAAESSVSTPDPFVFERAVVKALQSIKDDIEQNLKLIQPAAQLIYDNLQDPRKLPFSEKVYPPKSIAECKICLHPTDNRLLMFHFHEARKYYVATLAHTDEVKIMPLYEYGVCCVTCAMQVVDMLVHARPLYRVIDCTAEGVAQPRPIDAMVRGLLDQLARSPGVSFQPSSLKVPETDEFYFDWMKKRKGGLLNELCKEAGWLTEDRSRHYAALQDASNWTSENFGEIMSQKAGTYN